MAICCLQSQSLDVAAWDAQISEFVVREPRKLRKRGAIDLALGQRLSDLIKRLMKDCAASIQNDV
jgi:hypothetical protein